MPTFLMSSYLVQSPATPFSSNHAKANCFSYTERRTTEREVSGKGRGRQEPNKTCSLVHVRPEWMGRKPILISKWQTVDSLQYHLEHKLHVNIEYHSVCPLVGIGTLPPPLSPASVPLPPEPRGGSHSPAGDGLGESQFRRLENKLSTLPTL